MVPPAALVAAALTLWGAKALIPIMLAAAASAVVAPHPTESLARTLGVSFALKALYWVGTRALHHVAVRRSQPRIPVLRRQRLAQAVCRGRAHECAPECTPLSRAA